MNKWGFPNQYIVKYYNDSGAEKYKNEAFFRATIISLFAPCLVRT